MAAGACLVVGAFSGAGAALADPPTNTYGTLVGVGSDTTQNVVNAIANGSSGLLASYDAVPLNTTIKTRASGAACATIARPKSSGSGEAALFNDTTAATGCIDFSRSSKAPNTFGFSHGETGIPFAIDAVSYGIRSDSAISKSLTLADLTDIYNCVYPTSVYQPLLPDNGSGTRSFFLSKLGFTDSATFTSGTGHTCIKDFNSTGQHIEENTGTYLTDPTYVIPFSVAQYLGQSNGVASNTLGKTVLGRVGGTGSFALNTGSSTTREVYNIVPTAKLPGGATPDANIGTAFVGTNGPGLSNNSYVCSQTATIQQFGFALDPNCGAVNQPLS